MDRLRCLVPGVLLPTFTWPHRTLGDTPFPPCIPPAPTLLPRVVRRVFGFFHPYLLSFSINYCRWVGIGFNNQIAQLPFGLVLKWSDGTRLEEVRAMMAMRSAGFPVPKVISYGEHPDTPHAPVSILMTRIPGKDLGDIYEQLKEDEREAIFSELQCMLGVMRKWPNPWGKDRICSIAGTSIRSVRVPNHSIKPCESESELNDQLRYTASDHSFASREEFEEKLACAKRMDSMHHDIVFTHGDLKHHNIMVHDGHISGFIDWESAGWYPDYWEFTTAMRFCPKDFWWYDFVSRLGGAKYMAEMECERALTALTVDSYAW